MGIEVEVTIGCSGCDKTIDEDDDVYCECCATGVKSVPESETAQCCECRQRFQRPTMISKVAGLMCFKCCKKYEAELLSKQVVAS